MKTQSVLLASLVPDPRNARLHDRRNLDTIKESLALFGQYRPFVVRREDRVILVGNGMHAAMLEMGIRKGDALFVDLSPEEGAALAILDNRSAELAEWDAQTLSQILGELPEELAGIVGFEGGELDALLGDLPPPPPPEEIGEGTGSQDAADTQFVFGSYRRTVPRERYEAVLEAIRQHVGFDEEAVLAELSRRIGL